MEKHKNSIATINLKYLHQLGMKLLIYTIDDIQDYFEFIIKKHEMVTNNTPIKVDSNKIKNRIVFKIKNGYKLELLTLETMKLLGSTKKVVDKDESSEIVPKLESVEVVLVHCSLVKTIINMHQKYYLVL